MSGIRITQAIDSNQTLIDIIDFNPSINSSPLTCPDKNCSANLVYVKGYIRRSYGKTQHIPAFFRLERGYLHNEFCHYGTSGMENIHADDSSHNILRALSRGNHTFRLHIIDIDDSIHLRKKAIAMQANPPSDTTDRIYVKKGTKKPYVKNMHSLREIYDYGKANPHLKNIINIVTRTGPITWSNFFYETSQLDQLFAYLKTVNTAQVAIIMKVNVVRMPIKLLDNKQFIEGSPKTIKGKYSLYPTIQLGNVTSKLFPLSKNVMVLGKFSIPNSKKMIMHPIFDKEIRTIVFSEEQVLVL
ncbi:hypothetical protein ABN080_01720 [Proteus sp. fly-1089]|uniref:hypothetical protein n=1 Tax=Proteus sp. fly-1089 TaxID=3136675 RepID=UPI0032DBECB7